MSEIKQKTTSSYEQGINDGLSTTAIKLFKECKGIKFIEKVTGLSREKFVKLKNCF